jgi:hypothetical protein
MDAGRNSKSNCVSGRDDPPANTTKKIKIENTIVTQHGLLYFPLSKLRERHTFDLK